MKRRVKEGVKVVDTSRVIVGTEDMVLLQNSNEDGEISFISSTLLQANYPD